MSVLESSDGHRLRELQIVANAICAISMTEVLRFRADLLFVYGCVENLDGVSMSDTPSVIGSQ